MRDILLKALVDTYGIAEKMKTWRKINTCYINVMNDNINITSQVLQHHIETHVLSKYEGCQQK